MKLFALLTVLFLVGCSQSGGPSPGSPPDAPTPSPGPAPKPTPADTTCLNQSCGDNILLHLHDWDLEKISLSLRSSTLQTQSHSFDPIIGAIVFGSAVSEVVPELHFDDPKTVLALEWLYKRYIDDEGKILPFVQGQIWNEIGAQFRGPYSRL